MSTAPLPDDPDLGQLRAQARDLQRGVRAGAPGSLALVAAQHPDGVPADAARFPLHAAQLVLARTYGFRSWPALVRHLEVVAEHSRVPDEAPASDDPATEFLRRACLTYGDGDGPLQSTAAAVLDAHPATVRGNVWVAAARADAGEVARLLAVEPGLAVREGGPHRWSPIAYLAYARHDPTITGPAVVATARELLDHGADPDTGYLFHGLPTPFRLLTGCFGGGEGGQPAHRHGAALARVLLAAGADPNDGQTLYNRMFTPDDDHLELLFEFGLGTGDGGPWRRRVGGDAPVELLRTQLSWAVTHGFVHRVALLADHGVDLLAPLPGGYGQEVRTPHEAAVRSGQPAVARLLEERGAAGSVDPETRLLGAVLAADRATALAAGPTVARLCRRHRPGLVVLAAVVGGPGAVRLAVELGWDVNALARTDVPSGTEWETALHHAAGTGDVELARTLLHLGADPDVRDRRFDAPPLGWARHAGQEALVALLEPVTGG